MVLEWSNSARKSIKIIYQKLTLVTLVTLVTKVLTKLTLVTLVYSGIVIVFFYVPVDV